jgi:hypothetical protein
MVSPSWRPRSPGICQVGQHAVDPMRPTLEQLDGFVSAFRLDHTVPLRKEHPRGKPPDHFLVVYDQYGLAGGLCHCAHLPRRE